MNSWHPVVVGFRGPMYAGKTTTAKFLKDKLGVLPSKVFSFGDPIKEETSAYFKFPIALCYSPQGKQSTIVLPKFLMWYPEGYGPGDKITVRKCLQTLGTFRRNQDPNYWIDKFKGNLFTFKKLLRVVIIDDLRFPSEVAVLKEWFNRVYVVHLNPYKGYEIDHPEKDNCVTETSMDDFQEDDYVFNPDFGQLKPVAEMLYETVLELFNEEK